MAAETEETFSTPNRIVKRGFMTKPGSRHSSFILFFLAVGIIGVGHAYAACNQPPIPTAGQTVTWTKANSPFQVCTDLTIPKGGKVVVEPGVRVDFQAHTLTVSGSMSAQGQATSHITFTAQDVFPPAITMQGGTLTMGFADVTGQFRGGPGKMTISDSTFRGSNGLIFTLDILLPSLPPVVKITRCSFINSSLTITDTYLALTDSTFTNSAVQALRGYVRLLGTNTVDGQPFSIIRETIQAIQPMLVDGVKANNVQPRADSASTEETFF
jgi:hypothetical protein